MLESVHGNQVSMRILSNSDLRLRGEIILKNTTRNNQIVFKMKSTNPRLFQAEPIKALVAPGKSITIVLTTTEAIPPEAVKQISQKNKFMIEFVALEKKVSNLEEGLELLRGQAVQSIKIYISTSSIRSSNIGKSAVEASVANSNRFSYHSMAVGTGDFGRETLAIPSGDQLDKINTQIEFLQKKRVDLIKNSQQQIQKNKGGLLKTVLFLVIGMIAGNLGGKAMGVRQIIQQKFMREQIKPEPEEQGIFSIFNFGEPQQEQIHQKSEKSWWQIL